MTARDWRLTDAGKEPRKVDPRSDLGLVRDPPHWEFEVRHWDQGDVLAEGTRADVQKMDMQ
jgi:hypothetical protein